MRKSNANESSKFELNEELVTINRTSKVTSGGRTFSFSAVVVVGDGQGKVGLGLGKASEVPVAIKKAMETARRNMETVVLNGTTLQHATIGRHGASKVFMRPASEGTGIIAGGAMRAVFTALGVENVLAKCLGSTNSVNVVKATIQGLTSMANPKLVAAKRGLSVKSIMKERNNGES